MTEEAKSIVKKDVKKYRQLVEYASEENADIFLQILNYLENILEK